MYVFKKKVITSKDLKVVRVTVDPERALCFRHCNCWKQLHRKPVEEGLAVISQPLHILVCLGSNFSKRTYNKQSAELSLSNQVAC